MDRAPPESPKPAPASAEPQPAEQPKSATLGEQIASFKEKVEPILKTVFGLINTYGPVVSQAWKTIYPFLELIWAYWHIPQFQIVLGLLLLFWGGNFCLTVAVIEAFRLLGLKQVQKNFTDLFESIRAAKQAYEKDLDPPSPAQAPAAAPQPLTTQDVVLEAFISGKNRKEIMEFTLKMKNVLKAVDPEKFSSSFTAVGAGCMTVLATLQSRLAQTIALGASIATMATGPLQKIFHDAICQLVAPEFHKWVDTFVSYGTKIIGISLAFFFQPWILTTNLCMKSATMIIKGLIDAKYIPKEFEDTVKLGTNGLAVIGILKQFIWGYRLPWLFWLVLWPGLILEWIFSLLVFTSAVAM